MADVGNNVPNCNFAPGDQVILFPDEEIAESGYHEHLAIRDTRQVLQVPSTVPMEVATMLPGGALTAYSAVLKARAHIQKLLEVKCKQHLSLSLGFSTLQAALMRFS